MGKSTLFNRLIEESKAIVSPVAGTTRDRNFGTCRWAGTSVTIVDTGGLDVSAKDEIERNVTRQAEKAAQEADVIIQVVDASVGPLPQDFTLSHHLLKVKKPVLLVANKADNPRTRRKAAAKEWLRLARGLPIPVSAVNGSGVGDLLDQVMAALTPGGVPEVEGIIRIAIVGKPNVGKSSLVNSLLGEERVIVSPIAGTTREPQDTLVFVDDKPFILVDTVGIRKRARIEPGLEKSGVRKTFNAIERADVVFFVIDLTEPVGMQDRHLADLVHESGKAVVIVANKWDALKEKDAQTLFTRTAEIRDHDLRQIDFGLVEIVSALKNQRTLTLFAAAEKAHEHWKRELSTGELDAFLRKTLAHEKKFGGAHHPYIYKLEQKNTRPPTFALAIRAKRKDATFPEAYMRFFVHQLREKWDFSGTPIRVVARHIAPRPG